MTAEQYVYDSHGRRNPFLPPPAPKRGQRTVGDETEVDTAPLRKWFGDNISGILYDPGNPRVLIGDEIVETGQEINGCTIVEIRPEGIVFEYMKKRVEVPLAREEEKETQKDEHK